MSLEAIVLKVFVHESGELEILDIQANRQAEHHFIQSVVLGTLSLLGIVIIGNFGQVFFLLGITDEKCH